MFIIGIVMIVIGVAIFLFGINCDEYTTFQETLDGGLLTIPGYGNTVLILIAIVGIILAYILSKFGITEYSYAIKWLILISIALKLGIVTFPLLFEALIPLLIGLELLLPEAVFNKIGDFFGTAPGGIAFLVVALIVSFRINGNNLNV